MSATPPIKILIVLDISSVFTPVRHVASSVILEVGRVESVATFGLMSLNCMVSRVFNPHCLSVINGTLIGIGVIMMNQTQGT